MNIHPIDFPMTRAQYLASWKIFRNISNENEITAKHILSLPIWKGVKSILDLGCGDGLITKSLLIQSPTSINKVKLLDPDHEMLEEAFLNISDLQMVDNIEKKTLYFDGDYLDLLSGVDLVIAVHVAYLIDEQVFRLMINNLPKGQKLVVILDQYGSVFSEIWKITAPKYFERSEKAKKFLDNLDVGFTIRKTQVSSELPNPISSRAEIKNALISLLSYADFKNLNTENTKKVMDIVANQTVNNKLLCTSACYEILCI